MGESGKLASRCVLACIGLLVEAGCGRWSATGEASSGFTQSELATSTRQRPTYAWATYTPGPTIPSPTREHAANTILTLDDTCRLPCLWGISPGDSTMHDVDLLAETVGSRRGAIGISPGGEFRVSVLDFLPDAFNIDVYLDFLGEIDTVSSIILAVDGFRDPLSLRNLFSDMMPLSVLRHLGVPDRVLFSYYLGSPVYDVSMIYDTIGASFQYNAPVRYEAGDLLLCPGSETGASIEDLRVILTAGSLDSPALQEWASSDRERALTISSEVALGLDASEFTRRMLEMSNDGCFESSEDIWEQVLRNNEHQPLPATP